MHVKYKTFQPFLFVAIAAGLIFAACGTDLTPRPKLDAAPPASQIIPAPDAYIVQQQADAQLAADVSPDAPTPISDAPLPLKDAALTDSGAVWCGTGSKRETYSGNQKNIGVGICRSRLETCDPSSGEYVLEHEEVLPMTEIPWDDIDQDCDGGDPKCPVYVSADAADAGVETGSPTSPWRTIQAAVKSYTSTCDTAIVKRGTYREQISMYFSRIKVLKSEEGPSVTIIDSEKSDTATYGIKIQDAQEVFIEGFTITNAKGAGLIIYSASQTTVIQHNIFVNNNTGITVVYGPGNNSPVTIRNNIIIGDNVVTTGTYGGTGVFLCQNGGIRHIENNLIININSLDNQLAGGVFIDNWSTGYVENNIIMNSVHGIYRYYDYNTTVSQYNCFFGNAQDYVSHEVAGAGDVHADPKFVGTADGGIGATADFHLSADSPCRNAGNPDPALNDVDGTRNDIGPYGGPFGKW